MPKEHKFKTVKSSLFDNRVWGEEDTATIKMFGEALVVKIDMPDKLEGDRTLYRIYEPSHRKVPVIEPGESPLGNMKILDRHLMLTEGLLHKDGTYYAFFGCNHMWPRGVAQRPKDEATHQLWKKAQLARVKEICNIVFPESEQGYLSKSGQIVVLTGQRCTTADLDDMEDSGLSLEPCVGWKVFHDMLGTGELVKLPLKNSFGEEIKPPKFAVRWRKKCGREGCKSRVTFYTKSGCHSGAYCYVCDLQGNYLADLRNQYVVCDKCAS